MFLKPIVLDAPVLVEAVRCAIIVAAFDSARFFPYSRLVVVELVFIALNCR
jgi:hypothetical protein